MNLPKIALISTLLFAYAYSDTHVPGIGFNFNFQDQFSVRPSFSHQSTFEFDKEHFALLHGFLDVSSLSKTTHGLNLGYRKYFDQLGFGLNLGYQGSNELGFYAKQFTPGCEIFFRNVQFSYNYFHPISPVSVYKNVNYNLEKYSQFSLSYFPTSKYEVGVGCSFNHITKKIDWNLTLGSNFLENWYVSLIPYVNSDSSKGASLSLSYSFGGKASKGSSPLKKSHAFYYTAYMPPPVEKLVEPQKEVEIPIIPRVVTPSKPPVEKSSVWNYLFFWRTSRAGSNNI